MARRSKSTRKKKRYRRNPIFLDQTLDTLLTIPSFMLGAWIGDVLRKATVEEIHAVRQSMQPILDRLKSEEAAAKATSQP